MSFFVPGHPKTAGSKRVFMVGGKPRLTDDSGKKGADWRGDVKTFAVKEFKQPREGALRLEAHFKLPRPKNHLKKDGSLTKSAPLHHTKIPDTTKLLRAVEDAMTGIAWKDDKQIVEQVASKCYTFSTPGVYVVVESDWED